MNRADTRLLTAFFIQLSEEWDVEQLASVLRSNALLVRRDLQVNAFLHLLHAPSICVRGSVANAVAFVDDDFTND